MADDDKTVPSEPQVTAERPAEVPDGPLAAQTRDLLLEAQKACAALDGVPVGSYRCKCGCGQVKKWDDPGCHPEEDINVVEARRVRKELREFLDRAYATIPDGMGWCRIKDPVWNEKCCEEGKKAARTWNRDVGSVLLWGKTGAGKTISAIATLHRILDAARDKPEAELSNRDLRWAAGVAFVSAPSLVVAWRNCPLGEEPDIVRLAKRATLLVLDEIGYEPFRPSDPQTIFEVLDHRYLARKRPTIITTELSEAKLMERYRPALYRRIRDIGTVRELRKA